MAVQIILVLLLIIGCGVAVRYVSVEKKKLSLKYYELSEIVLSLSEENASYARMIRNLSDIVDEGNIHGLTILTPEILKKCNSHDYLLGSVTDRLMEIAKEE